MNYKSFLLVLIVGSTVSNSAYSICSGAPQFLTRMKLSLSEEVPGLSFAEGKVTPTGSIFDELRYSASEPIIFLENPAIDAVDRSSDRSSLRKMWKEWQEQLTQMSGDESKKKALLEFFKQFNVKSSNATDDLYNKFKLSLLARVYFKDGKMIFEKRDRWIGGDDKESMVVHPFGWYPNSLVKDHFKRALQRAIPGFRELKEEEVKNGSKDDSGLVLVGIVMGKVFFIRRELAHSINPDYVPNQGCTDVGNFSPEFMDIILRMHNEGHRDEK